MDVKLPKGIYRYPSEHDHWYDTKWLRELSQLPFYVFVGSNFGIPRIDSRLGTLDGVDLSRVERVFWGSRNFEFAKSLLNMDVTHENANRTNIRDLPANMAILNLAAGGAPLMPYVHIEDGHFYYGSIVTQHPFIYTKEFDDDE